ncbi:MAG TPA: ABC transporter ATP-binding protein [Thermoleophilaceae bacterium]|nr:ABC transporter ATP-binding protein [Thermoleophilaceae bacterium]
MTSAAVNGSRPVAIHAEGLRKQFQLGEHQSLLRTVRVLAGRGRVDPTAGFVALGGVDFSINRGESLGIVGTNGSGKSTLLQILAGTTLPTSGEMHVHGRVVPLLAVGLGFHPELTGRENVMLFASSLGIPREMIKARMGNVADFAELGRHMDTPVKRFSSGMLSRLSFSIAMQFPADVYVFDEVLAVVDGEFEERCLNEIDRLRSEGRTVVFVSHNLDQVERVADRVLWMHQGLVERFGPTHQVLEAYHRHTAHEE